MPIPSLYARSPRKTPLLRKRHIEACLKFDTTHLDKPMKYWECSLVRREKKFTFMSYYTPCLDKIWHCTSPWKHYTNSEVWRRKHHGVGLFLIAWYWQTSYSWRNDEQHSLTGASQEESAAIHQDDEDETWVDLPAEQRSKASSKNIQVNYLTWIQLNIYGNELMIKVHKRAPQKIQDLKTIC